MVVMLTISLSLVARTSRELKIATQESESTQVLSAAETGLNSYLSMNLGTLPYNAITRTYLASPAPLSASSDFQYQIGITQNTNLDVTKLDEGVSAEVDVTGATGLTAYWGTESCPGRASIIISIYGDNGSTKTVQHTAHAGCDNSATDGIANSSASAATDPTGAGLQRQVTIAPLPTGATVARIRPVYADTRLHVEVAGATHPQGYTLRSTGTSSRGNETRVVQVDQTLPVVPSVLDYVLFSGNTLQK